MKLTSSVVSAALALAAVVATGLNAAPATSAQPPASGHWIATWTASPQPIWGREILLPTNIPPRLSRQTIRQVARVSLGGKSARVVLSNEYGGAPVVIGAAHIARAGSDSAIDIASDLVLRFGGSSTVTIAPGERVVSDPVPLAVAPLSEVAVTLFLPEPTALTTFHWDGRDTAYIAKGNVVGARSLVAQQTISARIFLSDILLEAPAGARAVVILGDSITDGNGATLDANRRWPDFLAQRLAKQNVAVLNAGISGARVLADGMGESALRRFERDVLSQPHVSTVVLFMGINDISWPGSAFAPQAPAMSASELIAGYRQLIARAHRKHVRIVAATLTPFAGALQGTPVWGYYSADKERVRQAVNAWIRSSGEFDAVIDFDAVTRDPGSPQRFLPALDSGDHLHPGDEGNRAMAESVDRHKLFDRLDASRSGLQ
ncbi:MAG: SGNH/GDSL hydrolase family protein [Pseudomonas sp.]